MSAAAIATMAFVATINEGIIIWIVVVIITVTLTGFALAAADETECRWRF
jgi:hypothetical protein